MQHAAAGKIRKAERLTYPFRAILFQYKDKPGEWHVCCVDNGACGWGSTPDKALNELALTLQGQIKETFETGHNFFFQDPDNTWLAAFEKGSPPGDDIRLVARVTGELSVSPLSKPNSRANFSATLKHTAKQLEPA